MPRYFMQPCLHGSWVAGRERHDTQPSLSIPQTRHHTCRGNVEVVLDQKDERGAKAQLLKDLELEQVLDRDVEHLSGEADLAAAQLSLCIGAQHDDYCTKAAC